MGMFLFFSHQVVTLTEESSKREIGESETVTTELCLCVGWLVIVCCLHDQVGRDAMLDMEESDSAVLWAGERKAIGMWVCTSQKIRKPPPM